IPWHERFMLESLTPDVSIQSFWCFFVRAWRCRTFIVTDEGYMGFARPGTRMGDEVCILHGCKVPLIIRSVDNEYALVGDAYLSGMMKGEMVEKQEEGVFQLENVTLR